MYRAIIASILLSGILLTGSHAQNMHLCGPVLANSLAFVCRGRGYYWTHSKRSGAYVSKRGLVDERRTKRSVDSPFLSDRVATDFLTPKDGGKVRVRRGIVDECCHRPCNYRHLESYCAPKTTTTSTTTTTTTTAPPTTATTTRTPPVVTPSYNYAADDVDNSSDGYRLDNDLQNDGPLNIATNTSLLFSSNANATNIPRNTTSIDAKQDMRNEVTGYRTPRPTEMSTLLAKIHPKIKTAKSFRGKTSKKTNKKGKGRRKHKATAERLRKLLEKYHQTQQ